MTGCRDLWGVCTPCGGAGEGWQSLEQSQAGEAQDSGNAIAACDCVAVVVGGRGAGAAYQARSAGRWRWQTAAWGWEQVGVGQCGFLAAPVVGKR